MLHNILIVRVSFQVRLKRIIVCYKREGVNYSTGRPFKARRVTIDAFIWPRYSHLLFESEAWRRFEASEEFEMYMIRYPSSFSLVDQLQQQSSDSQTESEPDSESESESESELEDPPSTPRATVQDILMEWDIAKTMTYENTALNNECTICYTQYKPDTMVSVLSCKHVTCISCFNKWPVCSLCSR